MLHSREILLLLLKEGYCHNSIGQSSYLYGQYLQLSVRISHIGVGRGPNRCYLAPIFLIN